MFRVLHRRKMAETIKCPVSTQEIQLCGFAFVDDTDLFALTEMENNPVAAAKKCKKPSRTGKE